MAVASERLGAPAISAPTRWRGRPAQVGLILLVMLAAFALWRGDFPWPSWLTWTALPGRLDDLQGWLLDERTAENPNLIFAIFDGFRALADWLVTSFTDALEWMTWIGVTAAGTLLVWRFGGWRAGLTVLAAFAAFALMGLWEPSMQTLALMFAAVLLSLIIGVPVGIWAGRNARVHRALTPALDAMQIVPAFAYLMPVVILFSVGPAAAVICTMIYAVPPAVRITALGIRGVTADTVEASKALGATPTQTLFKVQLPLARKQLLLALNQTIMFALSLVVIAGLIGGRGLGDVVTNGLYSNAALALLAGAAIVVMAIALDRSTAAIAEHTDPTRRHLTDDGKRRARRVTLAVLAAIVVIVAICRALGVEPSYPDEFETASYVYTATLEDQLLSWIQSMLDYVQDPASFVFGITEPIGNFLVEYALEPLRVWLVEMPWFVTIAGFSAIALVVSGLRPAITVALMLLAIGIMGVWDLAMDTASQVLVATALAVAIGIAIGVWAAESPRVEKLLRPLLDTLQTLPQLVYIIPFIYLMPVSRVPGVVASVLYAVPVIIRLVTSGVRNVAPAAVEAASAFGATRGQVLMKVKIPLARDAIMLGVNQGIIMVLAVVVIGGLVGSGALGDEVARGLQRNEFGQGVVASLAILALGIALDRVTQSKGRRVEVKHHEGDAMGTRRARGIVVAIALAAAMTVAACGEKKEETPASGGSGGTDTAAKDCGKVVINENAWAGSTANVYIAKAVLEEKLGCEVEVTKVAEIPVFQAMADGEVDAVLEDWQHVDEYKKYIEEAGTVVDGGPLGVEGHIGWFIPKYLMDTNPEFASWEGLKGNEELFKTAESGDQGMFLGGDPSYVQKDKELIKALDLNLKHVTAGAEPAQVARWTQLYKQEKPVIFYWYTPQFYNQEYDLAEVKLPERTADCKDDAKSGGDVEQYKCAYDVTVIEKLFSKKFADSGSPAYDVLKKMELTNDDQEAVAKAIAGDKVDPEKAGADWVEQNQDKVQQWLG